MIHLEFLLEEPSMEAVLINLLPSILPKEYQYKRDYFLRPHNGKSELQKSIPIKIKAFKNFHKPVAFVILHDQDSNDCINLKANLSKLCHSNENLPFLIRIVCHELESWYLGDMKAIETAYRSFNAKKFQNKAKYRNPDRITNAAEEMTKLIPHFQKLTSARAISQYMSPDNNRSHSFNCFVSGLKRFIETL